MKIKELIKRLNNFPEDLEVRIGLWGDSEEVGLVPLLEMPIDELAGLYSSSKDRTTAIILRCQREDDILNNGYNELNPLNEPSQTEC